MHPPDYAINTDGLAADDRHGVMDTAAERAIEDIALLATQVCAVSAALVSLVAADRQWFKAGVEFKPHEAGLSGWVRAFALIEPDLFVIPDLSLDERTRDNPLVTGTPFIRFYAGAPLRTPEGQVIGSLCVIDGEPRPEGLTEQQASSLRILAGQVTAQLELRRAIAERDEAIALQQVYDRSQRESEAQFRGLFEAIDDGFCVVEIAFDGDRAVDYRFIEVNPAFATHTGLEDARGRWMRDLAPEHEQYWFDIYGRVALTGEPVRFEHYAEQLDGRWFNVHAFRVGDAPRRQVAIIFSDDSDRKTAEILKQRAEALQEIQNQELSHRMKNVFAMIQAIASQTLRRVEDRKAVDAFAQRLLTLSRAHDVLLTQTWTAARLSEVVMAVLGAISEAGTLQISGPDVVVGPRATLSISLLLHELATNAAKYGALSVPDGYVALEWHLEDPGGEELLVLSWREIGGPEVAAPSRRGFGSKLINMGLVGTGDVDLRYLPSGLEADFRASMAQVRES